MFAGIEAEQPLAIAMKNGAGRQHLRIKPPVPCHEPVEDAAMPVGPVHHRGDGKAIALVFQIVILPTSTFKRAERQNSLVQATLEANGYSQRHQSAFRFK